MTSAGSTAVQPWLAPVASGAVKVTTMGPLTFSAPRWMWAASAGRSMAVLEMSQQTSFVVRSTVTEPSPEPSRSPWPRTPDAFTSFSPLRTAAMGRPADRAAWGSAAWAAPVPMRAADTMLNRVRPQTFVLLRTDTSSDWPSADRRPIPWARRCVDGGFGEIGTFRTGHG